MSQRKWPRGIAAATIVTLLGAPLSGEADVAHPTAKNVDDMEFVPVPGLPTCAPASVQTGDPAAGPSVLLGSLEAGCVIPWHWHSPNEHLMIVSGSPRLELRDGTVTTLRPGAFARMPSRHVHQLRCVKRCSLYVYSDGPLDIHYVDEGGKELSPDEALAAVKEVAAPAPK